jgi:hypothetical protein
MNGKKNEMKIFKTKKKLSDTCVLNRKLNILPFILLAHAIFLSWQDERFFYSPLLEILGVAIKHGFYFLRCPKAQNHIYSILI